MKQYYVSFFFFFFCAVKFSKGFEDGQFYREERRQPVKPRPRQESATATAGLPNQEPP